MIAIPDVVCRLLTVDPLVARYRTLFAQFDWSQVPERDPHRPWPGSPPQLRCAYLKALVVKLAEHLPYVSELRRFLIEHPLLVLELGFRPVPDPSAPYGFDVARTVPGERWLRHQQQLFDQTVLQALLRGTVTALRQSCPDLGETIAIDVKHSYAWVAENNPKETIAHRFDPARQPRGDPDCRLGVKRQGNQTGRRRQKTFLWGYGTGIATTIVPGLGDVVLAEWTQSFNHQDVTYALPLLARVATVLGHPPTNLAADAAFDAWYVYEPFARRGGIAAIARNHRGRTSAAPELGPPTCARGLPMVPTTTTQRADGAQIQRYRCPLLFPTPTGQICERACFFTRHGCTKRRNTTPGARLRRALDRTSAAYQAIYRQRTAAERINSQAVALGIERPKVRSAAAIQRLNTLTYLLINVRALTRLAARGRPASPSPPLC